MESDGEKVITKLTLLIEYLLNTLDYYYGRVAGRNIFIYQYLYIYYIKMALQRKSFFNI